MTKALAGELAGADFLFSWPLHPWLENGDTVLTCILTCIFSILSAFYRFFVVKIGKTKPHQTTVKRLSDAVFSLERMMGIEPTRSAWEAEVLPLNYIRK